MAVAGLTPTSLDWRLTAAIGVVTVAVGVVLLLRYREQLLLFGFGAALLEVGLLMAARGLLRPFVGPLGALTSFLLIAAPAAAGIALLQWRRWWSAAGFTPLSQWRRLRLFLVLALLPLLPALNLVGGIHVGLRTATLLVLYTVLATSTEELFYRGIVLRATIGYGVIPSVLISSALFGLSHINGLFASYQIDPRFILGQAWTGFLVGIFLGAVRLRMNTIWPTMLAHAAFDLPAVLVYGIYAFTYRPTLGSFLFTTAFGVVFAAIGLFLIRKARPDIIPIELKS
jgi:membrane protease YdiL (CAAX protease family)